MINWWITPLTSKLGLLRTNTTRSDAILPFLISSIFTKYICELMLCLNYHWCCFILLTITSLVAFLKAIISMYKKINKKVYKFVSLFDEVALEKTWFIFSWREKWVGPASRWGCRVWIMIGTRHQKWQGERDLINVYKRLPKRIFY